MFEAVTASGYHTGKAKMHYVIYHKKDAFGLSPPFLAQTLVISYRRALAASFVRIFHSVLSS